jgi:hypothetical protein
MYARRLALVAVATLWGGGLAPATGQVVRGVVRDSASGEAIGAAVVWTTDTTGRLMARSIGDVSGRFSVARFSGRATLHLRRIGYRPRDLVLNAADSVLDLRLQAIAWSLATVTTSRRRVCPSDKGGSDALDVWEQARNALLASVVAREAHPPRLHLTSFERELEPVRRHVTDHVTSAKEVVGSQSYIAGRPPWALAAEGYMKEASYGERTFFAPDETTMLDPSFAATHCLRLAEPDARHAGEIGLAFDPVEDAERDTLVEVRGVLWLEPKASALRSIEFEYTALETLAHGSGGEIVFRVMPNGAPMIQRWSIRTAIIANDESEWVNGVRKTLPPRWQRTRIRLLAYRETGGEVVWAQWPDGSRWPGDGRVSGIVVDAAGASVAGARVWMQGGADTVTSGADGRFAFPRVGAGTYSLFASDSALARQGVSRTVAITAVVGSGADADVIVGYHNRENILTLACPNKSFRPGTGVLFAHVVDATGASVASPRIEIWKNAAADTTTRPADHEGEGGEDGRLIVCGASMTTTLKLRASKDGRISEPALVTWTTDEVVGVVLTVHPKPR